MSTTSLVPIDTKPIEIKLAVLREHANSIVVSDALSYEQACQIALEGRAEIKAIGFVLDPGIESASRHLDMLRNHKNQFVNQLSPIIYTASKKAADWKAEERRKAEAEEARLNEQRRIEAQRKATEDLQAAKAQAAADRKRREAEIAEAQKAGEIKAREAERLKKQAAEDHARAKEQAKQAAQAAAENVPQVKVEPAVPKVAGIKARVNWHWKMKQIDLVPRQFLYPLTDGNGQYDPEKFPRIGRMVRETKDKAKAEAAIPGIEVWSEDAV